MNDMFIGCEAFREIPIWMFDEKITTRIYSMHE